MVYEYMYVPRDADHPPIDLRFVNSERKTAVESHLQPTAVYYDDWRATGLGEVGTVMDWVH